MVEIINWNTAISSCKYDESVGIRIAKISGNEDFCTFITIIDPNKNVNPHYHKYGDEHYHIIQGNGEIKLKNIITGNEQQYTVSEKESFVIHENIQHQLKNIGDIPLILMFSCPMSHVESDRHFS
jgi:mannose-6-phosphate isomerase-like protein (cupin superfamily)